jgi:hypothetical protein
MFLKYVAAAVAAFAISTAQQKFIQPDPIMAACKALSAFKSKATEM